MLSRYLNRSCNYGVRYRHKIVVSATQKYATQTEFKPSKEVETLESSLANARPYEEIPGPTKYEFLRSVLPGGDFYKKSVSDFVMLLYRRYGPLFRMPGMFGKPDTYLSMNPADFETIFRNEGQWPNRRNFASMVYHRQVHRRDYFGGIDGILSTSGEEWYKVRTAINPVLLQPKNAKLYLNTLLEVNDEFLERIREIRDPETLEMPASFEDEINRLTFESVAAVALNKQLGLIRKNRDTPEAKTIMRSLRTFFDLAFDLDVMPSIWKIVKTPKFNEMMRTLDTLTDICSKYINEALARIERDTEGKLTSEVGKEQSVLEKLVRIDKKIAVVMAMDMMMAGVDTTSTTLVGIFLCIAKNPAKQQLLFEEIKQILPEKNSRLTMENMRSLPYLRATIKEGMRTYPIGPGTMRSLPHDVVLSGYRVRKGSDVAMGANLLMQHEEFFPQAKEFLPERWLRNEQNNTPSGHLSNPFMFVPFGFGPRSCAGIRIVNLEMEITVARLVRNFHIEFNYPIDNAFKAKFINVPNIPLKFKFEERSS